MNGENNEINTQSSAQLFSHELDGAFEGFHKYRRWLEMPTPTRDPDDGSKSRPIKDINEAMRLHFPSPTTSLDRDLAKEYAI